MNNRNPAVRFLSTGTCLLLVAAMIISVGCKDDAKFTEIDPSTMLTAAIDEEEPSGETQTSNHETASFYTVAHYDVEADPAEQLVDTLTRAKSENKTVLLQVGGDWCGWCKLMTNYIDENAAVNKLMLDQFLIQKVTYDDKNKNEEFLSEYPEISGYPHIFVLNADGEMIHSQDTAELEEGNGYSEEKFVAFLEKWVPAESNE